MELFQKILDLKLDTENDSVFASLREKCPYSEFFWSLFPAFGIKMERYRIKFECGKIRTRKTPHPDTFHAVHIYNFETRSTI